MSPVCGNPCLTSRCRDLKSSRSLARITTVYMATPQKSKIAWLWPLMVNLTDMTCVSEAEAGVRRVARLRPPRITLYQAPQWLLTSRTIPRVHCFLHCGRLTLHWLDPYHESRTSPCPICTCATSCNDYQLSSLVFSAHRYQEMSAAPPIPPRNALVAREVWHTRDLNKFGWMARTDLCVRRNSLRS